jgi:hypothetical protein
MKRLQLYLETSVWNFFFADDAPEKKEITVAFCCCSGNSLRNRCPDKLESKTPVKFEKNGID